MSGSSSIKNKIIIIVALQNWVVGVFVENHFIIENIDNGFGRRNRHDCDVRLNLSVARINIAIVITALCHRDNTRDLIVGDFDYRTRREHDYNNMFYYRFADPDGKY